MQFAVRSTPHQSRTRNTSARANPPRLETESEAPKRPAPARKKLPTRAMTIAARATDCCPNRNYLRPARRRFAATTGHFQPFLRAALTDSAPRIRLLTFFANDPQAALESFAGSKGRVGSPAFACRDQFYQSISSRASNRRSLARPKSRLKAPSGYEIGRRSTACPRHP